MKLIGKWSKYFASSGCYMYIHTLTRDVVSIRPEEYEDVSLQDINQDESVAIIDPANGIQRVDLVDLPFVVNQIIKEKNRTPLIFDCSKSQPVLSFYKHKGNLEVCDVMALCVMLCV